jgi:hypothetical protein
MTYGSQRHGASFPRKRESSASDSEHVSQVRTSPRKTGLLDCLSLTYVARRRGPLDSRFRGNDTARGCA